MHALGVFTGFVVVATLAVCAYTMFCWANGWRIVAAMPIFTTLAPVGLTMATIGYDPALQNVWPLKIMLWCLISLMTLGACRLAKGIWEGKPAAKVEAEAKS